MNNSNTSSTPCPFKDDCFDFNMGKQCKYFHPPEHQKCPQGKHCPKKDKDCKRRHKSDQFFTMFHGTHKHHQSSILTDGLKKSRTGMLGEGIYLTRQFDKASRYPLGHKNKDQIVVEAIVNVGKVKRFDQVNRGDPLQKSWHTAHESAWVAQKARGIGSGQEENCIKDE